MNSFRNCNRISERFTCDVPVQACSILETRPARIVDLSIHGAQIRMDDPYAQGQRIHLDLDGDLIWADVQWAEIDRCGLKFVSPLASSHPLARVMEAQRRRLALRPRAQPAQAGFGRRAA